MTRKEMAKQYQGPTLTPGTRVRVQTETYTKRDPNLRSLLELNGRNGIVEECDGDTARVRLSGDMEVEVWLWNHEMVCVN
jgi:hypothetical protein